MVITDSNLHAMTWTPNNLSAGIDNNLAEQISMDNHADFMTLTIADPKGNAGALCSLNRPVPLVDGRPLQFLRVSWQIRPSRVATEKNRVYETDAILVWPPSLDDQPVKSQWYDGSLQANQSTTPPCIQIDKVASVDPATGKIKYGWQSTALTDGAAYKPDVWNPAQVDYKFDFDAHTTSVIAVNGAAIDPSLLKIPANLNNWSRTVNGAHYPLLKLQAQAHLNVPGSFEIDYQVSLVWSDAPIVLL